MIKTGFKSLDTLVDLNKPRLTVLTGIGFADMLSGDIANNVCLGQEYDVLEVLSPKKEYLIKRLFVNNANVNYKKWTIKNQYTKQELEQIGQATVNLIEVTKRLPTILENLRSYKMKNLDYEAKIKEICNKEDLILGDNLLNLIAQKQLNKDDLVDILNKAKVLAKIRKTSITEEIIEKAIKLNKMYKQQEKMLIKIKTEVEKYFNVNFINYNIKDKRIKKIRNIAIYLMREIGDIYCARIAKEFNIDSPLVLRIHQNIKNKITKDEELKKVTDELTRIIKEEVKNGFYGK